MREGFWTLLSCLVGGDWNMSFIFSHSGGNGIIIPSDEHIFRSWKHQSVVIFQCPVCNLLFLLLPLLLCFWFEHGVNLKTEHLPAALVRAPPSGTASAWTRAIHMWANAPFQIVRRRPQVQTIFGAHKSLPIAICSLILLRCKSVNPTVLIQASSQNTISPCCSNLCKLFRAMSHDFASRIPVDLRSAAAIQPLICSVIGIWHHSHLKPGLFPANSNSNICSLQLLASQTSWGAPCRVKMRMAVWPSFSDYEALSPPFLTPFPSRPPLQPIPVRLDVDEDGPAWTGGNRPVDPFGKDWTITRH